MAKTKNTVDIGFEKEIWKEADLLRGNLDASEYKSVVLGAEETISKLSEYEVW